MNTNNDESKFIPIKRILTGNDEYKEPKSCGNCIHRKSCGAYWLFKKMIKEMHKEFGSFIQFPMPPAMLAEGCKEYTDKRRVIEPEK